MVLNVLIACRLSQEKIFAHITDTTVLLIEHGSEHGKIFPEMADGGKNLY
jgi:hypothetical protein